MASNFTLADCLRPYGSKQICWECSKACGGCPWTERDPATGEIRFEPVEGWTAQKVQLNLGGYRKGRRITESYRITACPEFQRG